uniref:Uncharacterized protein n=1 Tax=Steinernema glaseri TaxID=37863 RepID=A0A1I7ZNC7_9BILA
MERYWNRLRGTVAAEVGFHDNSSRNSEEASYSIQRSDSAGNAKPEGAQKKKNAHGSLKWEWSWRNDVPLPSRTLTGRIEGENPTSDSAS